MTVLLAFTTSTPRFDAAIVRAIPPSENRETPRGSFETLARVGYGDEMRHAERLFGVVDAVLKKAGITRSDIDAIACDIGPGSFTGVRVGLASAKGMALALSRPLLGVSAMAAMNDAARQANPELGAVITVLDGKRGELFVSQDGEAAVALKADIAAASIAEWVSADPNRAVCGIAADVLALPGRALIRSNDCDLPAAPAIARVGARMLWRGDSFDLGSLEPIYVRPPDAKLPKPRPRPF